MNESNSLEIYQAKLTERAKIRLDIISETENYFHQEINQRKVCSKKLSKYVAAFDYIDKVLIVLVATSCNILSSMIKFLCRIKVISIASKHSYLKH